MQRYGQASPSGSRGATPSSRPGSQYGPRPSTRSTDKGRASASVPHPCRSSRGARSRALGAPEPPSAPARPSISSLRRLTNAGRVLELRRPRRAAPGRTGCGSSRRSASSLVLQPLHHRMVGIDLQDRLDGRHLLARRLEDAARGCRSCRARRSPGTPANRSGATVTRTSFTRSPSAAFMRLDQVLELAFLPLLAPSFVVVSRACPDRGRPAPPTRAACPRTRAGTTPPTRRRGRTAAAPRRPSCGRPPGAGCSSRARKVSAVT